MIAPRPARPPRLAPVLLPLGLAGVLVMGIGTGSSTMPPDRVVAALLGLGERTDQVVVWTLRLPRVLVAALAGAALALAGLLLQRATRNPLASPSVLGIVDGAALGVLTFLWAFSDEANLLTVPILWQQPAAAAGALLFAGLVALFARRDRAGALRLVLYGVALAALADALAVLMMIAGPVYRAGQALQWLAGSVHAAGWADVAVLAGALGVGMLVTIPLARPLDQLRLDDETAAATGLDVARARVAALALAVVLTAAAVSVAGGIGFVGLVAPHAARLLVGGGMAGLAPAAMMLGAGMVAGADLGARLAFAPLEVPAGAATALVGVPGLVALLLRRGRS